MNKKEIGLITAISICLIGIVLKDEIWWATGTIILWMVLLKD